jgi:hypothetical protein
VLAMDRSVRYSRQSDGQGGPQIPRDEIRCCLSSVSV